MKATRRRLVTCIQCWRTRPSTSSSCRSVRYSSTSASQTSSPNAQISARPTSAPRPIIDIKHIRQNPELHRKNCVDRNCNAVASHPERIVELHAQWQEQQRLGRKLRERSNLLRSRMANWAAASQARTSAEEQAVEEELGHNNMGQEQLRAEAKRLKEQLNEIEAAEGRLTAEMERLAFALPNLTSEETPRGAVADLLGYINQGESERGEQEVNKKKGIEQEEEVPRPSDRVWRSHVHIGSELEILDFGAAGTSSGWGWYYLIDEGAELEQALIAYAIDCTTRAGWRHVSPPSLVYSHIAAACGFQPRDAHGETQIYTVAQSTADAARGKPELCLAGTAEILLAGMKADTVIDADDPDALPLKRVAVSRCYRAEAGARGVDTKGLYRVHEFSKVEMFAWTLPDKAAAQDVWNEMIDLQTEMLGSLGLQCRFLEMPSADLGASASRKVDIEAFFPSRRERNDGWGEVTSASICGDYQTRRLATRLRTTPGGPLGFPWTVNGTAMAVPRVLAAILEAGWDEKEAAVTVPEVLRPWMRGREKIEKKGGFPK